MDTKAIFFDLDDTLHDSQKPFSDAIKKIIPMLSDNNAIESLYKRFREFSDLLWNDYINKEITLEELRIQRITLALQTYYSNISSELAKRFQKQYDISLKEIEVFPEVPELLERIKGMGIQLGIITNGPIQHQMGKIENLGLTKYISKELIFISDEVGVAKPHPEIFSYVAKSINYSSKELLYIGDSWTNDVLGSYQAGWKSIWFNHRKRTPDTDHKPIAEITELPALLSAIAPHL